MDASESVAEPRPKQPPKRRDVVSPAAPAKPLTLALAPEVRAQPPDLTPQPALTAETVSDSTPPAADTHRTHTVYTPHTPLPEVVIKSGESEPKTAHLHETKAASDVESTTEEQFFDGPFRELPPVERAEMTSIGDAEIEPKTAYFGELATDNLVEFSLIEIAGDEPNTEVDAAIELESVDQWLPAALKGLDPAEAEAAQPVIATVLQLVQEIQLLEESSEQLDGAKIQIVEQRLKATVDELLKKLNVGSNDAKVAQFIDLVKEFQQHELSEDKLSVADKLNSLLAMFNDLVEDVREKFQWVGRHPVLLAASQ